MGAYVPREGTKQAKQIRYVSCQKAGLRWRSPEEGVRGAGLGGAVLQLSVGLLGRVQKGATI